MTPEQLKSTCNMFQTELKTQGASMGIMSVFNSMCSYLGGESRDLNKALAALEEAQQQAELAYAAYEGLQGFCVSRGEYDSLLNKHSVLARAHREAQQTIARQREALEFYANQEHWELPSFGRGQSKVTSDRGSKARELLKEGSDKA